MVKNHRTKVKDAGGVGWTCDFTKADVEKIKFLKDIKGFPTTIDLFRYLLTMEYDKLKDREAKNAEILLGEMITNPSYIRQERIPILRDGKLR